VLDGASVCAGGRVVSLVQQGGETIAECDVWLDSQDGTRNLVACAWVALPRIPD